MTVDTTPPPLAFAALEGLRRARLRAIAMARATNTCLVVYRDGKIALIPPRICRSRSRTNGRAQGLWLTTSLAQRLECTLRAVGFIGPGRARGVIARRLDDRSITLLVAAKLQRLSGRLPERSRLLRLLVLPAGHKELCKPRTCPWSGRTVDTRSVSPTIDRSARPTRKERE
jgi:hypothetical protein